MTTHNQFGGLASADRPGGGAFLYYLPLFLAILLDAIGTSLIVPILTEVLLDERPTMLAGYSENTRQILYGVCIALFGALVFYFSPLLGDLSDRRGRKFILFPTLALSVAGYLVMGLAVEINSAALLIAGRIAGGIAAANLAVSQSAILDRGSAGNKHFLLNMCLTVSSAGFILGPVIAGLFAKSPYLSVFGLSTPFYFVMLLAALTFGLLAIGYREAPRAARAERAAPGIADSLKGWHNFVNAFTNRAIREVSIGFLLMQMAWGAFFNFFPAALQDRFDFSIEKSSILVASLGIGYVVAYGVILPMLRKVVPVKPLTVASLAVTAGLILVESLTTSEVVVWGVLIPLAISVCVAYGAIISLYTDAVEPSKHGWALGISVSVELLAISAASLISGFLSTFSSALPIVFSAALMMASGVFLYFRRGHLVKFAGVPAGGPGN